MRSETNGMVPTAFDTKKNEMGQYAPDHCGRNGHF